MKKIMISTTIILFIFMTFVFADFSGVFEKVDYNITIGNDIIDLGNSICVKDNRTYVPIRSICNVLRIPINWLEDKKEIKIDINNKEVQVSRKTAFKKEGVVPDEETALCIGKVILEKYSGRSMEYETGKKIYYLRAQYIEKENAWLVVQNFLYKNPNTGGSTDFAEFPNVKINKNTGEVMFINTCATYVD